VIGVAEQSGAGKGGVGLQQSITGGAPQGISCESPAGTLKLDGLKLYMRGGRLNLISATSDEISPHPAPNPAPMTSSDAKTSLRMVP
jgi:hypothetical protein